MCVDVYYWACVETCREQGICTDVYNSVTINKSVGKRKTCMLLRACDGAWGLSHRVWEACVMRLAAGLHAWNCLCLRKWPPVHGSFYSHLTYFLITAVSVWVWVLTVSLSGVPLSVSSHLCAHAGCTYVGTGVPQEYLCCCIHVMGALCLVLLCLQSALCICTCGRDILFLFIANKLFNSPSLLIFTYFLGLMY